MELLEGYQKIRTLKEETGVVLATAPDGRQVVIKPTSSAASAARQAGRPKAESPAVSFWKKFGTREELAAVMPEHGTADGWVWHEYLPGEPVGDTVTTFGWRDGDFSLVSAERLAASIAFLQSISNFDLPKRQAKFYLANLWETHKALEKELDRGFYEQVREHLSSRTKIVDRAPLVVANGDLHPQNIIVSPSGFGFADWDLLHLNNPGFDLVDIYVWAWRDQDWRKKLLEAFLAKNPDAESSFKFCLLYLSSQMVKHCLLMRKQVSGDTARDQARKGLLEASKKTVKQILKGEFSS